MHLHALVFICLSRSVHLLDDHGNAVTGARVRSRGFDVGQRVERKADGASGVITEITAEHVVLQTAGGQLKEATAEGFVEGLWQKATERQAPEMVHDWATRAGPASVEFQRCLLRSQIFEALRQQHEDLMPDLADAVSVSQKPREIRALQDFAAKGLVVPVTTTRVDIKREEDAEHGAGLIIGKVVWNTIKSPRSGDRRSSQAHVMGQKPAGHFETRCAGVVSCRPEQGAQLAHPQSLLLLLQPQAVQDKRATVFKAGFTCCIGLSRRSCHSRRAACCLQCVGCSYLFILCAATSMSRCQAGLQHTGIGNAEQAWTNVLQRAFAST